MLEDSITFEPWSAAYFTSLLDAMGRTESVDELELCAAGSRNGNIPVGEAWLFEATRRWSIPAMFRKV